MGLLIYLIQLAFDIYIGIIIIQIIIHWLVAFDVLKTTSPQAKNLMDLLRRLTDPVYKPIQKYVPPIGGIDITPIIVIIGLKILEGIILRILIGM